MSLKPVVKLTNQFLEVLTYAELAGVKIDLKELARLKETTATRLNELEGMLQSLAQEATGQPQVNLNSPQTLSELLYSRRVYDKKVWKHWFNLGSEVRNSVRKKKHSTLYPQKRFNILVRAGTRVTYVNRLIKCRYCDGKGSSEQVRKDGRMSRHKKKCKECSGGGVRNEETNKIAGFKLIPTPHDPSALGFKTDQETINKLIETGTATGNAKTFIEALGEFNRATKYLNTVIAGIERNTRRSGFLHTNFTQSVTATGRLSSTNPNLHNQVRGETFPIRRVFVSRFEGGKIIKADSAQLEFRVAADLARCETAMEDIRNNVDVHEQSARILTEAGQKTNRQDAKSDTFKPLYGGTTGTPAQRSYYAWFLDRYSGIKTWHELLLRTAIRDGRIQLPSGRRYAFPNAKRYPSGSVAGATQIKNYPVQGFATADCIPLATIEAFRLFRFYDMKTIIWNEVHDEIVTDSPPDEVDGAVKILRQSMLSIRKLVYEAFGYKMVVPLGCEIAVGDNWLDCKTVLEEDDHEVLKELGYG